MVTSYTKLSNVIGAPFSNIVLKQLYIRAAQNSTTNRTNEQVLFLANKSGWARLVSSVDITLTSDELKNYYTILGLTGDATLNKNQDTLARNWILEAGTAIQSNENGITLRQGIGPDGAYGLGGTEELGYRPMPGLTSVQIETTGRLGSLRQATISFKVWNMNQLNIVEALYFRLGYSMLLEWGHTQYFENNNNFKTNGIYGIDNPFAAGLRKEDVQQAVARKAKQTSGNYDGMLGIVSNFTWSFNQEGGYDCTVRLVGLGAVMDSTRINQLYKLPDGTIQEFKKNQETLAADVERRLKEIEQQFLKDLEARRNPPGAAIQLDPTPNSPAELEQRTKDYDSLPKNSTFNDFYKAYGNAAFVSMTVPKPLITSDYYTLFDKNPDGSIKVAAQNKYGGLWINHPWTRIPLGGNINFNTVLFEEFAAYVKIYKDGTNNNDLRSSDVSRASNTVIGRLFDYGTRRYVAPTQVATTAQALAPDVVGITLDREDIKLTDPLYPSTREVNYLVKEVQGGSFSTDMYVNLKVIAGTDSSYVPTRQQLINALDAWIAQPDHTLTSTRILQRDKSKNVNLELSGIFTVQIENVAYSGPQTAEAIRAQKQVNPSFPVKTVPAIWTITTNNTGFITGLGNPNPANTATQQPASGSNSGDANGAANQAKANQIDSTSGFESALSAMLVVIQTQCQTAALEVSQEVGVKAVDIRESTSKFFNDGSLNGVLTTKPIITTNSDGIPFDVVQYALKGYNSSLMVDPTLYNTIPDVNFEQLCTAYVVKYAQGGEEGAYQMVHSPVYLQFGYLLAFLNNMCLIYDSTQETISAGSTAKSEKRPYIYIDFNPGTNFCLTSPQQFSVDPFTCLIPFNATLDQYKSIFPSDIAKKIDPIFAPQLENVVSDLLEKGGLEFKNKNQTYQGNLMNILLNIDYLLGIVKEYSTSDPQHAVNLQPFLERILIDVNKSLGNTNAFRVAYRDDSNTVQIQDDQWVPSLAFASGSESSMMSKTAYLNTLKTTPEQSGLLPIFGSAPGQLPVAGTQSLVRQFQLKTTLSTKLASMIAISAQAATGSVNATDHSSLSYLNRNFKDRYKPFIQDPSNGESGADTNTKSTVDGTSNDQKAAEMFNEHVKTIYSNLQLSGDKINLAKNYYIERMSKVKSGDPITSAAPFIPADLEMTIDGISGIIMGNAFTIPEDRLPFSLRGENGLAKVAFIVTGLTHTIQSNEWLTRIKGQMIKLREDSEIITARTLINQAQQAAPGINTAINAVDLGSLNLNQDWITLAFNFIAPKEGFLEKPKFDYTRIRAGYGSDIFVTTDGKVLDVVASTVFTRADAERTLRYSIEGPYKKGVIGQIGQAKWDMLNDRQKAALVSYAYNAGAGALRTWGIRKAIETNADSAQVATLITRGPTTAKNVNTGIRETLQALVKRRQEEAKLYLS
jgi:GH24 family phage-related lysozyme (muramidase)